MWQQFLDLWSVSLHFRVCVALFLVGLYINFLK
jgi:hypothetical protein